MKTEMFVVATGFLLAGCSGGASPSSSSRYSSQHPIQHAADLTGSWRICDTVAQGGRMSEYNPIPYGGMVFSLAGEADGNVSAVQADPGHTDPGADAGAPLVISGPIDMTTRVWNGMLHVVAFPDIEVTFSPDGTRVQGYLVPGYGPSEQWYGGRADTFTCDDAPEPVGADAGSSAGHCTGEPTGCESLVPPNCGSVDGCELNVDVVFDEDSCQGAPSLCSSMHDPSLCAQQGCNWNP